MGIGNPAIWIVTLILGVAIGAAIGAFHGYLIAYAGIPSFIVTLGGLLVWRGGAWWVIRGETVAPMDATFKLIGGGPFGSIGPMWSWVVGLVACVGIIAAIMNGRRQRKRFKFPHTAGLGRSIPVRPRLRGGIGNGARGELLCVGA